MRSKVLRHLGFFWGIGGITLLLGYAIVRLAQTAARAFEYELYWYHWVILIVNVLMMMYYEGYKGFQLAFSPRAAARARFLRDHGSLRDLILAPFFCMAYYAAPKRRKMATWILTIAIIILILLFQQLPQPVRGILDVGVVVGLSWGIAATLYFSLLAITQPQWQYPAEVETDPFYESQAR